MRHETYGRRTTDVAVCVASQPKELQKLIWRVCGEKDVGLQEVVMSDHLLQSQWVDLSVWVWYTITLRC
jgi:hypothetical protein